MKNLIEIISEHSLTVRCLPHEVVSYRSYVDGDENKKYVDSNGNAINSKREVIIQDFDLEYFKNTAPPEWSKNLSPEKRFETWRKNYPNGRKLLKETRSVQDGGWWYVKETKNTDSTVRFDRKRDKFFAPTLEEAIQVYLNSKH